MQSTYLPVGISQSPFQNPSRGNLRRIPENKPSIVDPGARGFATSPLPAESPVKWDLARLAWHFEREHHERLRRGFVEVLKPWERMPSTPVLVQLRALRGAIEHHFYRNERLLFPEMRKCERITSKSGFATRDPLGPVERSNRDLRRMLTQTVRMLELENTKASEPASSCAAMELLESVGRFLVLERELLLPRCRDAFQTLVPNGIRTCD
ncbi:MAG: hypothetical protein ACKO5K_02025 [Armatimonadota bacterium]